MYKSPNWLIMAPLLFTLSCGTANEHKQQEHQERSPNQKTTSPANRLSLTERGGEYSFGDDVEAGPVGSLTVHPLSKDTALFYLDVCRGAPSYNLGQTSGKMVVKDTIAIYEEYEDELFNCKLKFHFRDSQITIETETGREACGFGGNVYVDYTYYQESKVVPEYFIAGNGDTILFRSLLSER